MQPRESSPDGVQYYQVRLGRGNDLAAQGIAEGWVGTGWLSSVDLTNELPDEWRTFNAKFVDEVLKSDGVPTKVGAGLACSATWTVAKGLRVGDFVITPDPNGVLHFGKIIGDYSYSQGSVLPHRRAVEWLPVTMIRNEAPEGLRRGLGAIQTVANLTDYWEEIESIVGQQRSVLKVADEDVENPMVFALEKHLEDFLVSNWANTEFAKTMDIYEVDGEQVGRQFPSDTGNIDILAQTKDGKELVVIELKRGRVSDVVVGQLLRYMGYVAALDPDKQVRGIVIGTDDDQRFRRALSMVPNADFYRYEVSFTVSKVS